VKPSASRKQCAEHERRREPHTFFTSARPKIPFGAIASATITSENVTICVYAEPSSAVDQRFRDAEQQSREHHAPGARDAAENRDRERLQPKHRPHVRMHVEERRDQDPGRAREYGRDGERERNRDRHVDADEPRGVAVLHDREQRASDARAPRDEVQRRREPETDGGNHDLQRRHADAEHLRRAGGPRQHESARLFAERKEHDGCRRRSRARPSPSAMRSSRAARTGAPRSIRR
jgi:hypothetical protein